MKMLKIPLFILLTVAIGSAFIFWDNNRITVSNFTVSPENLPDSFNGFRIVQISDLHNKDFGGRLSKKIKEIKPDIIVITGDLIDFYHTDAEKSIEFIKEIQFAEMIFYVSGNHEHRIDFYPQFKQELEALGVITLDGKGFSLKLNNDEIFIAGMEDLTFFGPTILDESRAAFENKLQELVAEKGDKTGILLSHRPEIFEIYKRSGFDVVFTGHAHGGQFRLPFLGGVYIPNQGFFAEYQAGLYQHGKTSMLVSRGLGNSAFPFRIGNPPEIIVCTLEK